MLHDTLSQRIIDRAHQLGFHLAAILSPPPSLPHLPLQRWLAEHRHASLDFMTDPPRHLPDTLLSDVQSIVVVTLSYHTSDSHIGSLRIARYARGLDYHDLLRARLQHLATFIQAEAGADLPHPIITRAATDSAPLLERDLAHLAGLGWFGKNTLLIHPKLGSFTLIAQLLVNTPLDPTPITLIPDRCGSCSRCIDACPTQAIVAPYLLDARRCIAYWTIEASGPIPRSLRPHLHDLLFGCDICQEVCPWNRKAPLHNDPDLAPRPHLHHLTPLDLLSLTHRQFNQLFQRTPILRARRSGLARNAAVILGNQHDPLLLPHLATRLAIEPDPLVRGHIAWAISHTTHPDALATLLLAQTRETDPYTLEELRYAIQHLTPP